MRGRELEQLCCLGLPGEILVPELLARLDLAVESHLNVFFWLDQGSRIVNAYSDAPAFYELLPKYFAEHHQRDEYELMGGDHARLMRSPALIEDMRGIVRDERRVRRSRFYNEFLAVQDIYNPVYLKVRDGGRPVGMLLLAGSEAKPELDAAERARLARLAPFIAHGLAAPKGFDVDGFEDDDSGVMVFDRNAVLQHLSPSARRLLFLATHPRAGARELSHAGTARLHIPEAVRRLCAGGDPPAHAVENRWGRFVFRAYPLEPARGAEALVGMIVQRQVPVALALWRRIRELGLPAKQGEVCLHLASGRSYARIAELMAVSINTVAWHVREIYARFDVHGAAELSRKLLGR